MFKRKTVIFLALVLAFAIFTSCGPDAATDGGGSQGGGDLPVTDNGAGAPDDGEHAAWLASVTPNLPEITFPGYAFRVLNVEADAMAWLRMQLDAESETGDIFNDAIYRRNRIIEDRYDILISETLVNDRGQIRTQAQRNIRAGEHAYDLYMLEAGDAFALAQDGALIDYNGIDYIDLSRIYWDQDARRDLSINNRLFIMTGDFTFANYSGTTVMFFNKQLHADLGLDNPYNMVHDGTWTFDAFFDMARQASRDLDGNGIFDRNDQYGYMSLDFLINPVFMIAGGERFMAKDSDDRPVHVIGGDRFVSVYHKMLDIMHYGNLLYDANATGRDHRDQDVMFPNNQALFWTELMNWAGILRGMENDFGILPHPKFDEAQPGYHSFSGGQFMGVPNTTADLDRTGIILEALCAESRKMVKPVYYDVVLQTVTARDEESGEMLDIIYANRVYEIGDSFFNSQVLSPFNDHARRNNRDVSAFVERQEGRIETAIERVMERFDEID
jgi:ABC-type glycerol-3-phosphate transport system substrate-binding protein